MGSGVEIRNKRAYWFWWNRMSYTQAIYHTCKRCLGSTMPTPAWRCNMSWGVGKVSNRMLILVWDIEMYNVRILSNVYINLYNPDIYHSKILTFNCVMIYGDMNYIRWILQLHLSCARLVKLHVFVMFNLIIRTETQLPPFRRQHFHMHFLGW